MANSCVLFFTDNAALVDIINKRASKTLTGHDSYYVTYYSAARYGGGRGYIILFRASHVPGLKNSRTSPVYRWRDSRNSRRRRTNFQQQCQRTYSRRVGQSLERMLLAEARSWLLALAARTLGRGSFLQNFADGFWEPTLPLPLPFLSPISRPKNSLDCEVAIPFCPLLS